MYGLAVVKGFFVVHCLQMHECMRVIAKAVATGKKTWSGFPSLPNQ